jgi:uncharacterized protein
LPPFKNQTNLLDMQNVGILTRIVVLVWLTCSLAFQSASAAQQVPRFEPLTISTAAGPVSITAEIADTPELRSRGLMFRHRMPEDRAMLFDFERPRPASMWMKNTYMSLDMFFVRADGSIAAIAEKTVPKSLDTISVQEPVRGVIEMAAGSAKRLGIKLEDRVFHKIFKP